MVKFDDLLLVLAFAVVIVWILKRLHLPPILGYLITGMIVGPYSLSYLESQDSLSFLAEFGVVFLLFTIGLELSLPKLIAMRRSLLGLGGMQVILCTVIVLAISYMIGLSWPAAITIAGALTLSSTAVATKQLIEQDELHQEHGKLSLSILLFQDLAAVPFLIIVPALAPSADIPIGETLLNALLMGAVVFLGMLAAGRWLLRPLFHNIAFVRSTELFMLAALLVVLVSAFITEHSGLSLALGGFLAGVMLAETEYVHQIEADIQPFRDILLGLFFITIGMKLDPRVVINEWSNLIAIVVALIVVKTMIIAILGKIAGASSPASLRAGLALAQGGEFGFALIALALPRQVLDLETSQFIIAAIIFSIALAPLFIRNSLRITNILLPGGAAPVDEQAQLSFEDKSHYENHVIICGYGRVGQTLARFLEFEGYPFIGLDMDPVRLKEARAAKEPVFYGDSTDEAVLKAAGIEKSTLLIVAYDDDARSIKCLEVIRRINRDIPVLVRTADDRHQEKLEQAGATDVISDRLESSLMLASHMLILLGTSPEEARQQVWEVKTNRYKLLQSHYLGQEDHQHLEEVSEDKTNLHAIEITDGAYAVGKTIEQVMVDKMPIQIASFSRNGFKCEEPEPTTTLQAGDVIVAIGTAEEIYIAEEKLLQG